MSRRRRRRRASLLGPLIALVALALLLSTHTIGGKGGSDITTSNTTLASYQSCVIARESSGDPQVWNKQGFPYWGLYQFGKPLWTANGGSASSWGNAPASTQTQIFYNVMSHHDGCSNWYPSDGCAYPANGCG